MDRTALQKIRRPGSYVVKAGETRPTKVVGRVTGRITLPTTDDRRAAREFLRLKRS